MTTLYSASQIDTSYDDALSYMNEAAALLIGAASHLKIAGEPQNARRVRRMAARLDQIRLDVFGESPTDGIYPAARSEARDDGAQTGEEPTS